MKKIIAFILIFCITASLAACGKPEENINTNQDEKEDIKQIEDGKTVESEDNGEETVEDGDNNSEETVEDGDSGESETLPNEHTEENKDDGIEDAEWDELEALGKIEAANGLFTVSVTVPADLAGNETQEELDAASGETYISAKINEDGSVTYVLTKSQHKALIDSLRENVELTLADLVEDENYSFTKIEHNDNFTVFDVTLSTEKVGLAEGFMAIGFYMYGGLYGAYSGKPADNVAVNYYNSDGELIRTANSSETEG